MSTDIIHYVDVGNFYSVYGVVTLIITILLIWYFVRTNIEHDTCKCRKNGYGKCRCICRYCTVMRTKYGSRRYTHRYGNNTHGFSNVREGFPIESPTILKEFPEFHDLSVNNGPAERTGTNRGTGVDTEPSIDHEPTTEEKNSEGNYKLLCGKYGDVDLCLFDMKDSDRYPEFDHDTTMHVMNMRTSFRQTSNPAYMYK